MALSHSCLAPSGGRFPLSIRSSVMSSPFSISVPLAFVYPDWDLRNPILNRVFGREIRQIRRRSGSRMIGPREFVAERAVAAAQRVAPSTRGNGGALRLFLSQTIEDSPTDVSVCRAYLER